MKYRLARSSHLLLVALLAACGGGDFTAGSGTGALSDAALDGTGSGGTTGDASPGTGAAIGSGGSGNSAGQTGSGGQTESGGSSSGGGPGDGGAQGNGGADAGSAGDASAAGGAPDAGSTSGGSMNGSGGAGGLNGTGGDCPDPTTWYLDADQDGYGSQSAPTVKSCTQPQGHYTKLGGDCNDNERDVHPQLTQQEKKYFGTPFKSPDGGNSYDYDCSGVETGDPSQPKAGTCGGLVVGGTCGGSGYLPGTGRGGATSNPYCGSKKKQTCTLVVATCTASTADVATPYGCN